MMQRPRSLRFADDPTRSNLKSCGSAQNLYCMQRCGLWIFMNHLESCLDFIWAQEGESCHNKIQVLPIAFYKSISCHDLCLQGQTDVSLFQADVSCNSYV